VTIKASDTTNAQLELAAQALSLGSLVAFPTETVYGLGADAENSLAIARMFEVKNRPANHPVIIHLSSQDQVNYWAVQVSGFAKALMRDYWPGPMTLIFSRSPNANDLITGGQDSVGLRVPSHPVALALIEKFHDLGGNGIVAPSANRYGAVSPTDSEAVRVELGEYLADDDMILDGQAPAVGVESTIIDCTGDAPIVLRPGAITVQMIEKSTGLSVVRNQDALLRVSGSHKKHYSPKAQVLVDGNSQTGEGLIADNHVKTPTGVIRLASPTSVEEYARILYSALRQADALGLETVRVVPPIGDGLAIAIRDRITRSAAE
jgi:L-threonylcarbamoyladenylate synthase